MADAAEETPSQRQARIRREKREAKIKAGGTERLDKITRASGRTPESVRREDANISPALTPVQPSTPTPQQPPLSSGAEPAQIQAQQEYLRALLRQTSPGEQAHDQPQDELAQDPIIKMLESLMGPLQNLGGTPPDPTAPPLDPNATPPSLIDPNMIANMTGIPPFLVNAVFGKKSVAKTPAQEKAAQLWRMAHILFSFLIGFYVIFSISNAMAMFGATGEEGDMGLRKGEELPAPATARNPFWVFALGELLLHSGRTMLGGEGGMGFGAGVKVLKDIARDGSIVVFVMGVASLMGRL